MMEAPGINMDVPDCSADDFFEHDRKIVACSVLLLIEIRDVGTN